MQQLHLGLVATSSLMLAGTMAAPGAAAGNTRFSDFTPLPRSAGPTDNEAAPITFGNPLLDSMYDGQRHG